MVEDNKEEETPIQNIIRNEEQIKEYTSDERVINFIVNKFKRLGKKDGQKLLQLLLENNPKINYKTITTKKSFYQYNLGRFDNDGFLKVDYIKEIKVHLMGFLHTIGKDIPLFEDDTILEKLGNDVYKINKYTTYEQIRQLMCDELGLVNFKYDFINPDMDIIIPNNSFCLQRVNIQILGTGVKFDHPIEYVYKCPQCGNKDRKKAYEVVSTNCRLLCEGIYTFGDANGEVKQRRCKLSLVPDNEISKTKDAYYFQISYDTTEGKKVSCGAFSFNDYKPGFYEAVIFKIKNPKKTELYLIIDIKPIENIEMSLPNKISGENYVITLQKYFDEFIEKQTNVGIYGLFPIKVSLILQKAFNELKLPLIANVAVIGSPSTGKSLVLKYYGFLLNNHLNLSTNGLSVSIPGLRGTKENVSLLGKDIPIITIGHLGSYKTIQIDESGENEELVQNMKTFLLEECYSYNKSGSTGIFNVRTAHVNISQNLNYEFLGQYRGMIRKAYKDLNITIKDADKLEWSEDWDLHMPLHYYNDNLYLRKIIKDKRTELCLAQKFWLDGTEMAVHMRFPFYFYVVNEKKNKELINIVKKNVTKKDSIRDNLEIMKALKTNVIDEYFKSCKQYEVGTKDEEGFDKVDEILDSYNINEDARTKTFFYNLLKISRILNKRLVIIEEDYNLIKWLLEKMEIKLDVYDTTDYKIIGPINKNKEKELDNKIEDDTKIIEEFELKGDFE